MTHRHERSDSSLARREIGAQTDLRGVLHGEKKSFSVGVEVIDERLRNTDRFLGSKKSLPRAQQKARARGIIWPS
jgi:hypothetical protein